MASGHVNRINRPNTWLHRPTCKREKRPCQLGAVHTWHNATFCCDASILSLLDAKRTSRERRERADVTRLTRSGHEAAFFVALHAIDPISELL
jgi:hypothetical protein